MTIQYLKVFLALIVKSNMLISIVKHYLLLVPISEVSCFKEGLLATMT